MLRTLYKIAIGLLIAVGAVHICFTLLNYDGLTLDALWFASAGVAIIFAGFLNLVLLSSDGKGRVTFALCLIANFALTLLFALALRVLREPQVFVGLFLSGFVTVASVVSKMTRAKGELSL